MKGPFLPMGAQAFLLLLFLCVLTLWVPGLWPVAVFLAGSFLLAIAWVLRDGRTGGLVSAVLLLLVLGPLWALTQIGLNFTVYGEPTLMGAARVLSCVCVVLLASGVSVQSRDAVWRAMLWFAFAVAVLAILQSVTSQGKVFWVFPTRDANEFMMGPILYHNHWAVFVEVAIPLALYLALRTGGTVAWVYAIVAATLYASVVIAASRSGVIVCTAEVIAVPVLMGRRYGFSGGTGRALALLFLAVGLCTVVVGPERVWNRMASEPMSIRADWDRSSLAMLRDHPWTGIGIGNWPVVYPHYATFDSGRFVNQAHNDWLQWAVEGGVFYAGICLVLAGIACRQAWRFPWAAGVPAVFCQALVDYPFSRPALAAWTLTVFGLSLREEDKRTG